MKKRKSWLLAIFAVSIITGLILALTFWPQKEETENNKGGQDEVVEEYETNNDDKNQEEPSVIYATSFTVNLPSTINIMIGTKVNLLNGYVQVQPTNIASKIKAEITPRYSSSSFGLELNNSTLIAKEVGTYNLTLSVPRSETTKFNKTILITVFEEETNAHVIQINKYLIKGEKTSIIDLFTIKEGAVFSVETDSKLTYLDNCFTAVSTGTTTLVISFTENYVQNVYEFKITVNDQPLYEIVLNNVTNNTLEFDLSLSSVFHINYDIQNREDGDVSQVVIATMEDELIAYVEDNTYPLIKIRAVKVGTTTLTLTCKADNSVSTKITIIVK